MRNVSFEVRKGETVGIIGRNGSGKSTLLQIIAGTLAPTEGEVEVRGRVAALLELGSGFNPEFTGRENVYLNGAILGLTRDEMNARFDAIVAFADIGEFIEQPVKMYSSGMVVRLAFAVQSQIDPEILIVDEALSVGDFAFQHKCMSQIKYLQRRGTSILLVSHDIGAIKAHWHLNALMLENGHVYASGKPDDVSVTYFHRLIEAERNVDIVSSIKQEVNVDVDRSNNRSTEGILSAMRPIQATTRRGRGDVRFEGIELRNSRSQPSNTFDFRDWLIIDLILRAEKDMSSSAIQES